VKHLANPNYVIHTYAANAIEKVLLARDGSGSCAHRLSPAPSRPLLRSSCDPSAAAFAGKVRITPEQIAPMLKDLLTPLFKGVASAA
jgi:hypothetical protein